MFYRVIWVFDLDYNLIVTPVTVAFCRLTNVVQVKLFLAYPSLSSP